MESLTKMSSQCQFSPVECKQTEKDTNNNQFFPEQVQLIGLSHVFTNCQYAQI